MLKSIFAALFTIVFAQHTFAQKKFDRWWNEVENYEVDGKSMSAYEAVSDIYKKAAQKENEAQFIKAFIYKAKYELILKKDSQEEVYKNFMGVLKKSKTPTRQILASLLAESLKEYYQENRYTINNRTSIDYTSTNYKEWTKEDFQTKIDSLYIISLSDLQTLIELKERDYTDLLKYGENYNRYQSTLADLLANRYLYYLKENPFWKNSQPNSLETPLTYFSLPEEFSTLVFSEKDTNSIKYKTISIYQKLTQLHLKQKDSLSTLITSLERLAYVKENSTFKNINTLYEEALLNYQEKFSDPKLQSWITYKLASFYYHQTNKKNNPTYYNKSINFCTRTLELNPNSLPAKEAFLLKKTIETEKLRVQAVQHILPNKPSKVLVTYKNIDTLYLMAYKVPLDYEEDFGRKTDSLIDITLQKTKPVLSKEFQLPIKTDYFDYTTEVLLPPLETGKYLLVFSSQKKPDFNKDPYSRQIIQVTKIGYINYNSQQEQRLCIIDRNTGIPLKNATTSFDGNIQKTDDNGFIDLHGRNRNYTQDITIIHNKDSLKTSIQFYPTPMPRKPKGEVNTVLLTDRRIYRPGQPLYFKGIVSTKISGKQEVLANAQVLISLYDTNDNLVGEKELTTNEFGSVHGEFQLPKGGNTGRYELEIEENFDVDSPWFKAYFNYTSKSIYVEEYKRPKFEVYFSPIDSTYVLNDSIVVKGKAKAFFGGNLSHAKVVYTVDRSMEFNWDFRKGGSFTPIEDKRIKKGSLKTDAQGNFEIKFLASSDSLIAKKFKPVFNFSINASVTDINGETHETSLTQKIGYHTTTIRLTCPYQVEIGKNQEFTVDAQTLNYRPSTATGVLKIYQYTPYERIIDERPWPVPEIQAIPKEEFLKWFPHQAYDTLDLERNRTKKLIKTINVDTEKNPSFNFDDFPNLKTGTYYAVFEGKGPKNIPLESKREINIFNPKDTTTLPKEFLTLHTNVNTKKHSITLNFEAAVDSLQVILEVAIPKKLVQQKLIALSKGKSTQVITLPKNAEKAVIRYTYMIDGYLKSNKENIDIIQKELGPQDLNFEIKTFRNKLEPGSNQIWEFKITNNNQPATAEVLASMYDASLDQFLNNTWNAQLYQKHQSYDYGDLPFIKTYDTEGTLYFPTKNQAYWHYRNYFSTSHTQLNTFGYDFNNTISSNTTYVTTLTYQKRMKKTPGILKGLVIGEDDLMPIPSVNVVVKDDESRGTTTDFDGNFSIDVKKGEVLVFSAIGMKTITYTVQDDGFISVALPLDSAELDAVVVTGYDNSEQHLFTGAYSRINADKVIEPGFLPGTFGAAPKITIRGASSLDGDKRPLFVIDGVVQEGNVSYGDLIDGNFSLNGLQANDIASIQLLKSAEATALYGARALNGVVIITSQQAEQDLQQVEARTNLKETAFFFPELKTNKKGEVKFNFTSPEALTKWNFQAFAHNKNLQQAKLDLSTLTQKELNIIPNFPRFFRSKDTVVISAKVNNLSKETMSGIIQLQFTDELTQEKINLLAEKQGPKNFQISPKGNTEIRWKLGIPENISAVRYKIVAKSGNFSDGEESIIPVLSNRIFITESLPIWVNPKEDKAFTFSSLKNNSSSTLTNHQFTFEYTSNPVWTALKSLPYLIEYPYECAEQTFARYYANTLSATILKSNPAIAQLLNTWKENGAELSDLTKNEALKNIVLEETPWLKNAQKEAAQQKLLANVLTVGKTSKLAQESLLKLRQMQLSSGAFPWFRGGRENFSISLHILKGMGRLLGFMPNLEDNDIFDDISTDLIIYLDHEFLEKDISKADYKFPTATINYVYARSFFNGFKDKEFDTYKTRFLDYFGNNWLTLSIQSKLTLAIIAHRNEKSQLAKTILTSLKENAIINSDYGMYWKEVTNSRSWNNAPIATQALAIEAFSEIEQNEETINQLKIWLLRNKKTEAWNSTKATTEAVYALLLRRDKKFMNAEMPKISIGKHQLASKTENKTGYFKTTFPAEEITGELATISIKNNSESPQYGAVYWQYFEESDKVQASQQENLSLKKQYFKKEETQGGTQLIELNNTFLTLGDIVTVRLIIEAKESFSFMHLKDLRAAGLEPIDVISKYKWQDGLGYYQSTRDVATHFFFDIIKKGTYIFEYDLRVNNVGDFTTGITSLQSMYAPEFSVQSQGSRLKINE